MRAFIDFSTLSINGISEREAQPSTRTSLSCDESYLYCIQLPNLAI